MGWTAFDGLLGRRAAALGVVFGAIVFLVMLGTDDVASTHAGRLGRLAALSSFAGAGGTYLAVAQARSRGEFRALGATGIAPLRAAFGGVIGGAFVGFLGVVLALFPGVDLSPLFPRALPAEGGWVRDGGSWLDAALGVRVAVDGAVSSVGARANDPAAALGTPLGATLAALAVSAVVFPLWATTGEPVARRAMMCFVVASAAVFVFHLVAAERTSAMLLVLPPLLLLADVFVSFRGQAWS